MVQGSLSGKADSIFSKKVLISCGFPVFGLLFKIDLVVRWQSNMTHNHVVLKYEKELSDISESPSEIIWLNFYILILYRLDFA